MVEEMEIQPVLGEEEMEVETRCRRGRRWKEMEVMEMKMVWILLLGGLSNPDLAEKNGPAGGGGGKNRANFESKLYQYHGPFHSWYSRKTGAEKLREKRVGVWSFWGVFLFEKGYRSKQLFHVEAVATAKDFANNFHD